MPSALTVPVSRSGPSAPDLSRSGCKPMRIDGVGDVEDHREAPGLDVAVFGNVAERHAPILAEVDRLDRAVPAVGLVVAHQAVDQRFTRHQLHLRIERGAHRQAALVELLLAVALGQFAAHFLGEEAGGDRIGGQHARRDGQRLGARGLRLIGGDVAVLRHAADHVIAALDRAVVVAERIERARLLGQGGEIGDFGDRSIRAPTCRSN